MMSRKVGISLSEAEHISQSLADLVSTPLGSRIILRDYGTIIADLLDSPVNAGLPLRIYSTIYTAVQKWEPRISISRIQASNISKSGQIVFDIEAVHTQTGAELNLRIPVAAGALT